jgi:hypothetical protein
LEDSRAKTAILDFAQSADKVWPRHEKYGYKAIFGNVQIEVIDKGDIIYVGGIFNRGEKGKGEGTALMKKLMASADKHNVAIELRPKRIGRTLLPRVYSFYKKLGFRLIKKIERGEGFYDMPIKADFFRYYPKKILENPIPPVSVAQVACRGLAKRRKYGRGGTAVGVARGRDLCNRKNISKSTAARMRSYFARHRASQAESAKRRKDPTSAAAIADDLWGGSPGWAWAKRVG